MKLYTKIGIEYTYLPNNKRDVITSCVLNKIKDEFKTTHDDCGALEIPSPVHKNFKDIKKFYKAHRKLVNKYKFKSHVDGIMSGGGHIHVDYPKGTNDFKNRFLLNFMRDLANRPYINWIFNEWCDDNTAEHFVYKNIKKLIEGKETGYDGFTKRDPIDWISSFYDAPCSVRKYSKTIELRFFDAKRNWFEVKLHVAFINKYYKYITDITKKGHNVELKVFKKCHLKKFTFKKSVKEFNELLVKLKLDPKDYKRFIDINYKERIKHGVLN